MTEAGHCPDCGELIQVTNVSGRVTADELDLKKLAGLDGEKTPWHFKLLVSLLCIYMGWRIVSLFI